MHLDNMKFLPFLGSKEYRDSLLCIGRRSGNTDPEIKTPVVPSKILNITGNASIDALRKMAARPAPESLHRILGEQENDAECRLILVTVHRRENFSASLETICTAIRQLAAARSDIRILFPVHPNPAVRIPVNTLLKDINNVHLISPLDYASMVHLMQASHIILTDSGGLQEEAPALNKPVLVLRETTERPEGVMTGGAKLVGTDSARIVSATQSLLDDAEQYSCMSQASNPYGAGHASHRIVQALLGNLTSEFSGSPDLVSTQPIGGS